MHNTKILLITIPLYFFSKNNLLFLGIFTAKAKPDRGLVNGKTGTQLIWEWLKKHEMDEFVTKVTAEKPRAVAYIDDKGVKFESWKKYWKENNGLSAK